MVSGRAIPVKVSIFRSNHNDAAVMLIDCHSHKLDYSAKNV